MNAATCSLRISCLSDTVAAIAEGVGEHAVDAFQVVVRELERLGDEVEELEALAHPAPVASDKPKRKAAK